MGSSGPETMVVERAPPKASTISPAYTVATIHCSSRASSTAGRAASAERASDTNADSAGMRSAQVDFHCEQLLPARQIVQPPLQCERQRVHVRDAAAQAPY